MRILQLCNKPPLPLVDGGCIAMHTISEGLLNAGMELKILTASTEKHPFQPDKIPGDFLNKTDIEGIFLDTRINVIDAFSALVTSDSYNVNRFFSPDFDKRLIELLQDNQYDIVHLESLFMTPYISTIRKYSDARIILRSHNLEHLIWERLASATENRAKKMYLKHLASKLKKYEQRTINEVDGIAAISREDTQRFKKFDCHKPIVTIPFGVDIDGYPFSGKVSENANQLFHIGAMNWEPNKEGVNWFIDDIWPKLKKEPLQFHLAGRYMPEYLKALSSDKFIVHGEVPSVTEFMGAHDIMLVPLLSGSGIRIKIIEGMACGKAIISTGVGAEGINYTDGENILIADTAAEITKAVKSLIQNPEKVRKIGASARKLIEKEYSNRQIIQNLIDFYKTV